jgi:hypothetical protein
VASVPLHSKLHKPRVAILVGFVVLVK